MAFPNVLSLTETTDATLGSTISVGLGPTYEAGDLIVVFLLVYDDNSVGVNWSGTGFTHLYTFNDAANFDSIGILAKVATGSEDGTSVTFTLTGGSVIGGAYAARHEAGTWWAEGTLAEAIEAVGLDGESASANPPSLTPSWGSADTTWWSGVEVENAAITITPPANYTDNDDTTQATSGSDDTEVAISWRTNAAASEDPAAWTWSGTQFWLTFTAAIRPADEVGGGAGGPAQGGLIFLFGAAGGSVTAITVNAIAAIPAATKSASVEKTATTINLISSVPAVTKSASVEKPAIAVAAVAAIPAVIKTASVEKAATSVGSIAAVPAAAISASATVTPATVGAVAAIPTPVTIGGTSTAPATVNAIGSIPAVTKLASVEKTATTVAALASIPAVVKTASVEKSASIVTAIAAMPAATKTASVEKAATAVSRAVSIPAVTTTASATKAAVTANLVALMPAATKLASVEKAATTVAALAAIPQAIATGGGSMTAVPASISAPATVPPVLVISSATKTAVTVAALVTIPATSLTASAEVVAVTITAIAGIPLVTVIGGLATIYDMAAGGYPSGSENGGGSAGVEQVTNLGSGIEHGGAPLKVEGS